MGLLMAICALKETCAFPVIPRLVVTIITPFAPFTPYTAVAEASFRILMDSTSLGSICAKLS